MKKLLLPLLAATVMFSCENEAEKEKTLLKIDNLESRVNELSVENDSLEKELQLLKSRNPIVFTEAFDSLENPEEFIVNALMQDSTLIPDQAVLGGKMHFIDTEILNERFIWAEYEDGHINGKAIYEYELSEEGKPKFRFISKVRDK